VIAGAGAGKTRVIAHRMVNLISSGIPAQEILAVTFTNKAAREMYDRISKMRLGQIERPLIATFHTLGATIVRENAAYWGLKKHFSISDQDDSISVIKNVMKESGIDPKRFDPRQILRLISRQKGNGVTTTSYLEGEESGGFWGKIVGPIWVAYEKKLRAKGALDFDDLLLLPVELLKREEAILESYRARWRYLLIDEYQDTNFIQYRLARLIVGESQNICAVGDLDQAIYSWRGADCRHLLRFERDYPGAKIIKLEENYRSTKSILAAANQIISKNVNRPEKNLFTNRVNGDKISLIVGEDERDEAERIAEVIHRLIKTGVVPSAIAILYRANFQSRVLEEAMLRAGVPYRVLGVRFFERREVKDALAYLKAALNPDDFESFKRALGAPTRGLGKVALVKIFANKEQELPPRQRQKIGEFKNLLAEIRARAARESVSKTLDYAARASGLVESLKTNGADDLERLENIQELVSLAVKYDALEPEESAAALLTEAALSAEQDSLDIKTEPAVNLMTVHASKGLEFNYVFVTGLEQSLFPHERPWASDENEERDSEEERRLFYVALTRACEKLFLTYTETRTIYGRTQINEPSEFLRDLDPDLFETSYTT